MKFTGEFQCMEIRRSQYSTSCDFTLISVDGRLEIRIAWLDKAQVDEFARLFAQRLSVSVDIQAVPA